ncbi:hypothetical protein M404DRAFT_72339, partial [Pisolithus tinctorius Marx 270]
GMSFTWVTDHMSLKYLLEQKDLSRQQACRLEKLAEFNFDINAPVYVGVEAMAISTSSHMQSECEHE